MCSASGWCECRRVVRCGRSYRKSAIPPRHTCRVPEGRPQWVHGASYRRWRPATWICREAVGHRPVNGGEVLRGTGLKGETVPRHRGLPPKAKPLCHFFPGKPIQLVRDCLSRVLSESPSWRPRSGSPINSRSRSSTSPRTSSVNCSLDNDERSMEGEYGGNGRNATGRTAKPLECRLRGGCLGNAMWELYIQQFLRELRSRREYLAHGFGGSSFGTMRACPTVTESCSTTRLSRSCSAGSTAKNSTPMPCDPDQRTVPG